MSRFHRRGHDLETIYHQFTNDDLADLKPKKMFQNKWIILKKVDDRGAAHCYQVCDKSCKIFGILYLELSADNVTSIVNQVEFSMQQFSLGYSHRFPTVIDSGVINNHVYYMVLRIRSGPNIKQLLHCLKDGKMSPMTASFLAMDILSVMELLNSSGHVLRNFDPKQWKLDVKTRTFYLDDTTDVSVSSDKRHRPFDEIHILNAETLNLHWTSQDLSYAPCSFIVNGPMHRMTELDMFEMFIYIIYDWARGHLPWKNSKCQQKTLELKREFLDNVPNVMEEFNEEHDTWFNTAVHNLGDHLKVARLAQEKLEKQAVRGGAWCPNGPRAGALLSIINYRRLIDDFHKIVCKGKPAWSVHWRDVKLDWDQEVELTEEQKEFLKKYELRQQSQEIVDEWKRLCATRMHYTIMKEHKSAEQEKNQIAIDRYLKGDADNEELQEEMEMRIGELQEKWRKWREEMHQKNDGNTTSNENPVEVMMQEIKEEIKKEEIEGQEYEPNPPPPSARQARLQRMHEANLQHQKWLEDMEKVEKKEIKEEVKDADNDVEMVEESDEEDNVEWRPQRTCLQTGIGFGSQEEHEQQMEVKQKEVKEEEPDDYDT